VPQVASCCRLADVSRLDGAGGLHRGAEVGGYFYLAGTNVSDVQKSTVIMAPTCLDSSHTVVREPLNVRPCPNHVLKQLLEV
jgi:hypothetical protein